MQSGKRMSVPAAMPASIYLMCQMLDFAEQGGMLKITPDDVATCTQATTNAVMDKFGITQDKVHAAVQAGQQSNQNQPAQAGA